MSSDGDQGGVRAKDPEMPRSGAGQSSTAEERPEKSQQEALEPVEVMREEEQVEVIDNEQRVESIQEEGEGSTSVDHDMEEMNSLLEPDPALLSLEVDDQPEAITYAGSQYPTVSSRYRTEQPYDTTTLMSSSRSLYADELDYVYENGRRYCGEYTYPNDELEQDRLRVIHQVYLNVFDLELTTVTFDETPSLIVDIGTGTGEWVIGMAEAFPECECVGIDISAIQPSAVPFNVFFEVDDCELEWMRPENSVDLVHMRNMAGAFSDWNYIYQEAFTCLKPGGSIEIIDFYDHRGPKNFYASFSPESKMHHVARQLEEGTIKLGRRRGTHHMDSKILSDLGYVDINVRELSIPLSPADDSVGKLWLIACLHGLEAGSLRVLTKHMGWNPADVFATMEEICEEFKSLALNPESGKDFKVNLKVLTAKKPWVPGHWTAQNVTENAQMTEYSGDDSTIGP